MTPLNSLEIAHDRQRELRADLTARRQSRARRMKSAARSDPRPSIVTTTAQPAHV
jgi:hypothetical protein